MNTIQKIRYAKDAQGIYHREQVEWVESERGYENVDGKVLFPMVVADSLQDVGDDKFTYSAPLKKGYTLIEEKEFLDYVNKFNSYKNRNELSK